MKNDTLIFIPTYNERENIGPMYEKLKSLGLATEILFMDDGSPDGTGDVADAIAKNDPLVSVIHRKGKMGIGSAHSEGIRWAYERGFQTLVTLDCDFTHQPDDIPQFVECSKKYDVVIGSRYLDKKSLSDWNLYRKTLTHLGHFLTRHLLKIPHDASGAFRVYRLDRITKDVFGLVVSKSYSFFFESLYILSFNGYSVHEISISLPKRTYGHSKMKVQDISQSVWLLVYIWGRTIFQKNRYLLSKSSMGEARSAMNHKRRD